MNTKEENTNLILLVIAAKEKAAGLAERIAVEVAPKFDGKSANKRLETALKAIDKNLRFDISFNSFKISLYIVDRSTKDRAGNHTLYLKDSDISIVHATVASSHGTGVCQNGAIIAARLIAELQDYRTRAAADITKTRAELARIDDVLAAHKAAKDAVEKLHTETSYITREYFNL